MNILRVIAKQKDYLIIFLTPLVLLPLPLVNNTTETKCAYGLLLMAVYWTSGVFPLAVTSMMPVFLFPMMGVARLGDLTHKYFTDTHFVFIGGIMCAITIEKWNVHKRFALRLLMLMGSNPRWLMLGFMLATGFLSMWISNTATTAMMVPIAKAVLAQIIKARKTTEREKILENGKLKDSNEAEVKLELVRDEDDQKDTFDFDNLDAEGKKLCKAVCLCVCYAANCGGIATLTGTGPNLVMKGNLDQLAGGYSGISFSTWFVFAFPAAFICLMITWFTLQTFFFGVRGMFKRQEGETDSAAVIVKQEYQKLGPMRFEEKASLIHFIILVILWFTQNPGVFPGWSSIFPEGYIDDAVPSIFIGCLLFIFPTKQKGVFKKVSPRLLDWDTAVHRTPWGVCLLLGGGFALAEACTISGLSSWLATQLAVFQSLPTWVMCLVICVIASLATEVTSNTATTTLLMPILKDLALAINIHPIYTMLPTAIATSFAFMLPVATPPNTIVFSYGYLKVIDMVKVGFILNFLCVLVITLAINTWGWAYFNLSHIPGWARGSNFLDMEFYSHGNLTNITNIAAEVLTITTGSTNATLN